VKATTQPLFLWVKRQVFFSLCMRRSAWHEAVRFFL